MNFRLIFAFALFLTFEFVVSVEVKSECVQRKSGACRVFNITEDFHQFILLDSSDAAENVLRISTIMEIDYVENKFSYHLNKTNQKQKELDIVDSPVVEILLSEFKNPLYSYRLVLGEKLNRLAYVEIVAYERDIKYNNYSPDLPSWPFAINVTVDMDENHTDTSKLKVYTRNGFDEVEPFLRGASDLITVKYMSIRSRNKNVKLVGFYDCSTKYGSKCGTEMTQTITDCKEKFSPLGSGFFNNFVDMSKFNRLGKEKSENRIFNYDEIFGVYRRNDDDMHILFTTYEFESGTFIRITIGDEITVHLRSYDRSTSEFHDKRAVGKGWNQEPSEPNFIRVVLSSENKEISIYKINDNDKPILTMKLCNYFDDDDTIQYMSVTSNRFKTVDLYYDCCLPFQPENCHVYKRHDNHTESDYDGTMDDSLENISDSTTTLFHGEYTTLESSQTDATTMLNENISSTIVDSEGTTTETIETTESADEDDDADEEDDPDETTATETIETQSADDYDDADNVNELETFISGVEKKSTFLDTSEFQEIGSTLYVYENGTSPTDYCPDEMTDVKLMLITEATIVEDHEDEDDVNPYISRPGGGLSLSALRSLIG